ncbi:hypothetical protein M405DRAFT_937577 [Rhizopogon salebrosus TDB-379]|nr:hypothetical protein M405DRAFT_937577 [Rhizopogon salebrosus TDB-379]
MSGDDFWGNDTSHARPRSAPPVGPSSLLRRRNLFDFLRFGTRLANTPQPIAPQAQPRRRKFRIPPIRPSIHTVNVAPARDEDRYVVEPPSQAEVAAAIQYASGDSSVQQSPCAAGAQGSQVYMQGRPTQTARCKSSDSGTGEPSYDIGCCGFYLLPVPLYIHVKHALRTHTVTDCIMNRQYELAFIILLQCRISYPCPCMCCDLGSININTRRTTLVWLRPLNSGSFMVFVPSLSQMRSPKVMSQVTKVKVR